MKKKKNIIILFIIIISVIAIILGICSMQNDNKENGSDKDVISDVKVEEYEDELIVVPSTQEESDKNGKKDSKDEFADPNINQSTDSDIQEDSEIKNEENQTEQNQAGQGIEMGENELPFVPAEQNNVRNSA